MEVMDTGPGIPPRERQRVRERFVRLAGQNTPGSGLGLSIVDELAEHLGAELTLDDGPTGECGVARSVSSIALRLSSRCMLRPGGCASCITALACRLQAVQRHACCRRQANKAMVGWRRWLY